MHNDIQRGEIYFADLDPVFGRELGGTRPVLIVQNNTGNHYSGTTIVAAIAQRKKQSLPTHVSIEGVAEMKADSMVLLEQLRTIDSKRISGKLCELSEKQMRLVDIALLASLGVHVAPRDPMVLSLCKTCAQSFYDSNGYRLRRADPHQEAMERCTICNVQSGFDFVVSSL